MAIKPIDLPPAIARRFVEDMRAYHLEENAIKRDEIAGRQLRALEVYQPQRAKKLRLTDIREMFEQMRGHLKK